MGFQHAKTADAHPAEKPHNAGFIDQGIRKWKPMAMCYGLNYSTKLRQVQVSRILTF